MLILFRWPFAQEGQTAEMQCEHPGCLDALRNAERMQRWHRRRPLLVWRR